MFIDIALGLTIILGGLAGFRDGSVRKAVSIVVTIGAMFAAQFFMHDLAGSLTERFGVDPPWAPIYGYLLIFFSILLAQSLIYRIATGNYKIGGLADRIIGVVLGAVHTTLVLSVVLMMLSLQEVPSKKAVRESRAYASVLGFAPLLVDRITTTIPEATEALEKLQKEGLVEPSSTIKNHIEDQIVREVDEQAKEAQRALSPQERDSVLKDSKPK